MPKKPAKKMSKAMKHERGESKKMKMKEKKSCKS